MTHNYYIKCCVCGSITRMQSPAGYLYKTPVRVHCGKCSTLLTGCFIADEKRGGCWFEPENCEQIIPKGYEEPFEYYGEASGEMLCHKICPHSKTESDMLPFISPVMKMMGNIPLAENEAYINYLCYLDQLKNDWAKERIGYDLFIHQKFDEIKMHCKADAARMGYTLESTFDIQRYFAAKYMYVFKGLFGIHGMEMQLRKINYEFAHLNKAALDEFLTEMGRTGLVSTFQTKAFQMLNELYYACTLLNAGAQRITLSRSVPNR